MIAIVCTSRLIAARWLCSLRLYATVKKKLSKARRSVTGTKQSINERPWGIVSHRYCLAKQGVSQIQKAPMSHLRKLRTSFHQMLEREVMTVCVMVFCRQPRCCLIVFQVAHPRWLC